MSQINSNNQKRLYAVAGVVFSASAVVAVLATVLLRADGEDSSGLLRGSSDKSSFLPDISWGGNDTGYDRTNSLYSVSNDTATHSANDQNSNDAPELQLTTFINEETLDQNSTNHFPSDEVLQAIAQNATSPTAQSSSEQKPTDVTNLLSSIETASGQSDVPVPSPIATNSEPGVANDDANFPTFSPTLELPTYMPSIFNDVPPKVWPSKRSIENTFRLKMHWEEGYNWQERTDERWWCMSCPNDGVCTKYSKLELKKCDVKTEVNTTFTLDSYGVAGDQFRITNTTLCLQKMGDSRAIKLVTCRGPKNKKFGLQLFRGFNHEGNFDLRPSGYSDRCLSQHHHPKANEIIYAETCDKAHKAKTGYWVKY